MTGSAAGILQLRNGYFWDPTTAEYFVPRGLAYQSFNPPVGAEQTPEQLDYDLLEFKKMYANSVRAEFVWNVVETNQGKFDWSVPNRLVAKAEELNLRLFVLIGFQYAPDWFMNSWKAVNDAGSNSFVLAYENPYARLAYSNYIYAVTSKYKNSPAIGGWILGNEYAYYDLWDKSRSFLGFDEYSLASFRAYLSTLYTNNIAAANSVWRTAYPGFNAIPMPRTFDRDSALYYDLEQWRKQSVGDYVALGAQAAKTADPNHLCTYSMVGGLFGEADIFYTCEDARTIVERCRRAGFPLDFWSINNYAIATLATELHSVDYGIAKHKAASGLPSLYRDRPYVD
jgi:beta-galactosidase GanA